MDFLSFKYLFLISGWVFFVFVNSGLAGVRGDVYLPFLQVSGTHDLSLRLVGGGAGGGAARGGGAGGARAGRGGEAVVLAERDSGRTGHGNNVRKANFRSSLKNYVSMS